MTRAVSSAAPRPVPADRRGRTALALSVAALGAVLALLAVLAVHLVGAVADTVGDDGAGAGSAVHPTSAAQPAG